MTAFSKVWKSRLRRWQFDALASFGKIEYGLRPSRTPHLADRLGALGRPWDSPSGPVSVLWFGANENQDDGGFLSGLEKACGDLTVARPRGQYGIRKTDPDGRYAVNRCAEAIAWNHEAMIEAFHAWSPKHARRLVFGQWWAKFVSPVTLNYFRERGAAVALLSMDDRHPVLWAPRLRNSRGMAGLAGAVDLVVTTVPTAVDRYRSIGAPAVHMPFGSSPAHMRTALPWAEREINTSFVGARYGYRAELIDGLEREFGLQVLARGPGWPEGPVDSTEAMRIYGRSKVVLGVSTVGYSRRVRTPKLRDLEGLSAGAVYLNLGVDDMPPGAVAGTHYLSYDSIEECATQIRRVLREPAYGQAIATRGFDYANQATWSGRLREVVCLFEQSGSAGP